MATEYLRGTAKGDECEHLFKEYKTCLTVRLFAHTAVQRRLMIQQKALEERGIDKMIDEAKADNKENDMQYLKPSIKTKCE